MYRVCALLLSIFGRRNAIRLFEHARQVTVVGESDLVCNIGKTVVVRREEFARAFQTTSQDKLVRGQLGGCFKASCKVKLAHSQQPGKFAEWNARARETRIDVCSNDRYLGRS